MSHYTLRSQSRRPRTSPSNDDSSGGIAKMFSSLKKKAAALVSTSPSPSFPSSPLPPTSSHVRSTKRHSRDRRPHTAPSHRPNTSSSRKHGLANHPRPPAIRPVTPRRDSSASTTSTTSTTSSTSDTSFDSSLSSSSIETPTSSPSPSPIPSSSKARLDRVHSEQISHLQDQISALRNAISPLPHAHIQRVSIIPEETESGNLTLIDSDSESTYSTDSLVPISSEQLHSQAAKRSSVLLALYPSSRPSTSEKKDCDPFAKDTVQVVHAFPGFGTSVTLKSSSNNSRSRPSSGSNAPSSPSAAERDLLPVIPDVFAAPKLPSTPSYNTSSLSTPRVAKRNSIVTLGQTSVPPPSSALPQVPSQEDPEYKERNARHLNRKEMASESDAEAEFSAPQPPPKDRKKDWTLCLGALEFYMDMQDPIERPSHPAPPPIVTQEMQKPAANSYLDMSPVLSSSSLVQPSNSSIRSVRSRTKGSSVRAPIIHSPPMPQAEFDRGVYESPRPAPLPPPLALMSLSSLSHSPSPSPSYASRRSTPASVPSPAPSHSSSRSALSYYNSTASSPAPSHSSRRRNGHRQSTSTTSQSTVMSASSGSTVRNYHMPSSHAYSAAETYCRGPQSVETSPKHPRSRSSVAYSYASSSTTNSSTTTTTTSLTVTTSTSTIGKRASRLIGLGPSSRKEKEKEECTSGWF